ncbi:MAG: hypothetical protein KTR24_03750 [Saprospiraceae bacterium]|nr:hypothetical protein [Saprospiraceae bacterium]
MTKLLSIWLILVTITASAQVEQKMMDVTMTHETGLLQVVADSNGMLSCNVPPDLKSQIIRAGHVRYSDFGAKGDGITDDIDAIAAAHAFANFHGLPVAANAGSTYYIKSDRRTAVIKTDTDFGGASFIVDDVNVKNRGASIFLVQSDLPGLTPKGLSLLKRNQEKVKLTLPFPSLITVTNDRIKRYIRFGRNQNNGRAQTDIFIVDRNGHVDMNAPIIWDFDTITAIQAIPIDSAVLTIRGGTFTTIANQAESKYNYHSRNILIKRSNVVVEGLEHRILGEGEHGAPYRGFISMADCAYITVRNCVLTGHKKYQTIGSAGKEVSMGSYDLSVNRVLNASFIHCRQTNDIDDRDYWGVFASNFSKNLLYDSCTLSRFDAHMGVANATIRNSTLGHMGINAIGTGTFLVENSTIRGRSVINLRSDYGSTWEGTMIIRNCTFVPFGGKPESGSIFRGTNKGKHDFGYICYMPEEIAIENLHIDDASHPEDYVGPSIFGDFNEDMVDDAYQEDFPYVRTKKVSLQNVTTASGMRLRTSDNPYMFKSVKIHQR